MINNTHLAELEALGCGNDVGKLEEQVALFQDAAADGEPLVEDSVYDQYRRLLEVLKPDSYVLSRNWERDGAEAIDTALDTFLVSKGMKSIRTCTNNDEISVRQEQHLTLGEEYIDYLVSTKLNGHAFRAVYRYGELVEATTRGRLGKGQDILRHMKLILPNIIDAWDMVEVSEVRGELLVKQSVYDAKYQDVYASPLSTVTSFRRASATDEEIANLSAVCYKLFQTDIPYDSLSEEMDHLQAVGFDTPYRELHHIKVSDLVESLNSIISDWGERYTSGSLTDYNCDGIVVAINENELFYKLGTDGNAFIGNLALKMGAWECNHYRSVIESIEWTQGKQWLVPKAHIKPVKTTSGQTVYVVPLYNVGVITKLNLQVGSEIHFRFGGETGVMLLTSDGKSVSNLRD
jgi:NAD-dependent DNA ligase